MRDVLGHTTRPDLLPEDVIQVGPRGFPWPESPRALSAATRAFAVAARLYDESIVLALREKFEKERKWGLDDAAWTRNFLIYVKNEDPRAGQSGRPLVFRNPAFEPSLVQTLSRAANRATRHARSGMGEAMELVAGLPPTRKQVAFSKAPEIFQFKDDGGHWKQSELERARAFLQDQIDACDACEEKTKFRFQGSNAPHAGGISSFRSIREGLGVKGKKYSRGTTYEMAIALRDALVEQLAKIRAPASVAD